MQVFAWIWICVSPWDGELSSRQLTPSYPAPSLRIGSHAGAPPLYPAVHSWAFLLLGSPAFICQWMLRDTRWQSAEALKHFRSKCPLSPFPLFFSFLRYHPFFIWLYSSFLPIWPLHRQAHADAHDVHTCIVISVERTHSAFCAAIGKCAKVCICVKPLALESNSRSLKHCL